MSNETRSTATTDQACDQLRLEHWPVERLVPSARNARTHTDAQVAEIAGSIRAFGFTNPILVGEDGDVVAGHGRLAAARRLGISMVPVVPLVGLTEVQRRQLMLAAPIACGWIITSVSAPPSRPPDRNKRASARD
jgi:hypothetical protein